MYFLTGSLQSFSGKCACVAFAKTPAFSSLIPYSIMSYDTVTQQSTRMSCGYRDKSGTLLNYNLVPRAFSVLKKAGRAKKPLDKAAKYSKNRGVFGDVKHDAMSSLRLKQGSRLQQNKFHCQPLKITSEKRHFIMYHVTKRFLEYCGSFVLTFD